MTNSVGGSWRRWSATLHAMSWRDRGLLLEAIAIVSALPVLLRVVRVRRLTGRLGPAGDAQRARPGRADEGRAREIARIVAMASRHTPNANTCLHRSVALWWLLGRRGLESTLHLGARRTGSQLDAHAWVEHCGAVVNDDPAVLRDYVPLSQSSAAASDSQASVSEPTRTERGVGGPARERVGGIAGAKPPILS